MGRERSQRIAHSRTRREGRERTGEMEKEGPLDPEMGSERKEAGCSDVRPAVPVGLWPTRREGQACLGPSPTFGPHGLLEYPGGSPVALPGTCLSLWVSQEGEASWGPGEDGAMEATLCWCL